MKTVIMIALAGMNVFSFLLMYYDKRCARRGRWRVPERTLLLAAACFGGLGGFLGMRLLRHKTRHMKFRLLMPLMLAAQAAMLIYVFLKFA